MRIVLFISFIALLCGADPAQAKKKIRKPAANGAIQVFQTEIRDGKLYPLLEKPAFDFAPYYGTLGRTDIPTFKIFPEKLLQKMDGYGANFTESCAINLLKLPAPQRREVMETMFSKKTGAGFDYLRLPMGATDFADGTKGSYTYDDTKNAEPDPEFKHLDLSRDEKSFALIREAKRINPGLHVMVSPWTAPAWMKPNKQLHDGWLDPEKYQDYANYFVKVLFALKRKGVPVDALTVQNEPFYSTKGYPSMYMSPKDIQRFIGDYLGPTLEKQRIPVRIFSHDHNWSQTEESNEILNNKAAKKYIAGVAFHCYSGTKFNMFDSYNAFPQVPMLQTECTGAENYEDGTKADPVNDFGWWLDNQSLGAARMGPTGTIGGLGWNLCLDEKNGPQNGIKGDPTILNGGCKACRGMVKMDFSKAVPEVIYNGEFWGLGQVSRFITTKSRRLEVEGDYENVPATAFLNPDGTIAFIAHNSTDDVKKFKVVIGGKSFNYELQPKYAVTFVWAN